MPVFEFRCAACGKKYQTLVGMTAEPDVLACPNCGAQRGTKLVSRFARYRTEDDRIDEVADRLEAMGEPESAGGMRDLVRDMGKAMDDDMADEMEEMLESDMGTGDE